MILLYSKFDVRKELNSEVFFKRVFTWINGMKDAPESFRNVSWNGERSVCKKDGKNCLEYEIDDEYNTIAFRLKVVDGNGELWTTDLILDQPNTKFQIRLAREKEIVSAYYSNHFHIPYFLRKLIEEGWGGADKSLPVVDRPFYIDGNNIMLIADLINQETEYEMPVIYVSHPFDSDKYALDVEELAKDVAGCAHVIVETRPEMSADLRILTNDKNAYNGAVDVFFGKDSLRYIKFADRNENQFRHTIASAVYRRLSMMNIDDDRSLTSIRIKNRVRAVRSEKAGEYDSLQMKCDSLQMKYDNLKEEREQDLQSISRAIDDIEQNEKRINELESKNQMLEEALRRKNEGTERQICLSYTGKEFYDDEIKTVVLDCLKREYSQHGAEESTWRPHHIMKDILEANTVSGKRDKLRASLYSILRRKRLKSQDYRELEALGFTIEDSSHKKAKFHNDDHYIITIASTPGDNREGQNIAHDAVTLIFGKN